eukprot:scaffold19889_cov76-Phaeocystis_antarctica.AAC.3
MSLRIYIGTIKSTRSEKLRTVSTPSKSFAPFLEIKKGSMVGFISNLAPLLNYLRRRSPGPPFPPDHRQAGERGAINNLNDNLNLLPYAPCALNGFKGTLKVACCGARGGDGSIVETAREEVARNAVEVIEVAKASLDDGEQMLAVARQKTLRLASIEGRKLLRQHPPCHCLVIVQVRDEIDLDALLVAAHCGTRTSSDYEVRKRAIRPSALSSRWAQPRRAASGSTRGRRASRRATAGCCPGRCTPCPAAQSKARACIPSMHAVRNVATRVGERHQPERRLLAGRLLSPLRPARHDRVLGAGRLLLITPRVAQEGGHLPHRRRHRALVQRRSCWWRSRHVVGEVRGVQPAGGQAAEELRGAFEHGVRIATADERRDRRRLFRLGTAPAQAPQAAVEAATVVGRGEGGTYEAGGAQGCSCPVIDVVVSLVPVHVDEPSVEHAQTQEKEAVHGPHPPQGGAGLYGAIAAAAQLGGVRGGGSKAQRSKRDAIYIWRVSRQCCGDVERAEPRKHGEENGARDADRACIGGQEGEEEEEGAQRGRNEPP